MQDFCASSFPCGAALLLCALLAFAAASISARIRWRFEWLLLGLGVLASTISWAWDGRLLWEVLFRPLKFCAALILGAAVFSFFHNDLRDGLSRFASRFGLRPAVAVAVALGGFSAAVLTSMVAALIMVEALRGLRLKREAEVQIAVLGCFAVGLGGGLSTLGGPVSAAALANLAQANYPVPWYYLMELLGPWIVSGIAALSLAAAMLCAEPQAQVQAQESMPEEALSLWTIAVWIGKAYALIAGLVLLGAGVLPATDRFLGHASADFLFWINAVSAALNGATMSAVEISPRMAQVQVRSVLMGILVVGGASAGGGMPNSLIARGLDVDGRRWVRIGIPIAALLIIFCFLSLHIFSRLG